MAAAPQSRKPQQSNSFLRFSGMAFQMAITIGGAVWLGIYLDRTFQTTSHAYTLTLSILGVGVGMFNAIRDLSRM